MTLAVKKHWSPEARAAARLRVISSKPWKKSTGPRTERGKKISSMNAYKHGYYSQEMRDIRALLRVMDARLQLLIQMRKAEDRNRKLAKKIFSRNELSSHIKTTYNNTYKTNRN